MLKIRIIVPVSAGIMVKPPMIGPRYCLNESYLNQSIFKIIAEFRLMKRVPEISNRLLNMI